MDSTQNPTAENCSQSPKQPKIQMESTQNPTAASVHNLRAAHSLDGFYTKLYCCKLFTTSPAVQPVQQNLLPNTDPTNCSQPSQLPKVQQNPPPKPTSESCSQPPHFARVQQDHQPHPAPPSSTQPTQTKPYPTSCFQPPQKPKVMTEQYIHPAVQAVKVVRSSLNQQCLDFSEANRGKQCTSISLTFLPVMPLFVKQRILKKY